MEWNSTISLIKSLDRQTLIDFLKEQQFTAQAELVQSRELDGEQFLNFTELDLVKWGIKANKGKLLLNCRNQLLARTQQAMVPKSPTTRKMSPSPQPWHTRKENQNMKLEQSRTRPLPDLPKNMNRPSSTRYIDMDKNIKNSESEENIEDYVDMNPQSEVAEIETGDYLEPTQTITKYVPKIPETGDYLEPTQTITKYVPKIPERPLKPRSAQQPQPAQKLQVSKPETKPYVQERVTRHIPVVPQLSEIDEYEDPCIYPEPTQTTSILEPSTFGVKKTRPPVFQRSLKMQPSFQSFDKEDIYAEPVCEVEPETRTRLKNQSTPLPPIPNDQNQTQTTSHALTLSLSSLPDPPSIIINNPESENKGRPDSFQSDMDFEIFPPPPPEFANEEDVDVPRPPKFRSELFKDHIREFRDLIPSENSSSDEEPTFNPNDYSFYRNTDRKGAKQLLQRMDHLQSDTFLIRPSTNDSYLLGMTIFHEKYFYNMGIYRDSEDRFYCESFNEYETKKFSSFDGFIEHYKNNPLTIKKRDGRVVKLFLKYRLPDNIF